MKQDKKHYKRWLEDESKNIIKRKGGRLHKHGGKYYHFTNDNDEPDVWDNLEDFVFYHSPFGWNEAIKKFKNK